MSDRYFTVTGKERGRTEDTMLLTLTALDDGPWPTCGVEMSKVIAADIPLGQHMKVTAHLKPLHAPAYTLDWTVSRVNETIAGASEGVLA